MIERYRPSNNTESVDFEHAWCYNGCKYVGGSMGCPVFAKAMFYDVDHKRYPKQLVWRDGQPCCTKFKKYDPLAARHQRFLRRLRLFQQAGQLSLFPFEVKK